MSSGIDPRAARLREVLRGRLVAAAATPTNADGEVEVDVLSGYLHSLVRDGAQGLAVLAHTGRGPFLSDAVRTEVVRAAVATGVPVIVGVGGGDGQSLADVTASAAAAARLGADGLLVFPPDSNAVAYHDAIWRAAGVPLMAFDLYTRPYDASTLGRLLDHPAVAGLKVARLSDAVACQRCLSAARRAGRLAVTGEDRMFGPSLMWGAEAALVGVAAAAVRVTGEVLAAYVEQRYDDFLSASSRLDRLAAATFTEPMEGYVQRMLWIAVAEGRIPARCGVDPHAPSLSVAEHHSVLGAWGGWQEELSRRTQVDG